MSEAVKKAKELLAEFEAPASEKWTLDDVLGKRDADKASEVIRLVVNNPDFPPMKVGDRARTDKSTANKMLTLRKTLKAFKASEGNPDYVPFWQEMLEINDYYFLLFVKDLAELDENLMDGVNELRVIDAEKKAESKRKRSEGQKARRAKEAN